MSSTENFRNWILQLILYAILLQYFSAFNGTASRLNTVNQHLDHNKNKLEVSGTHVHTDRQTIPKHDASSPSTEWAEAKQLALICLLLVGAEEVIGHSPYFAHVMRTQQANDVC